MSPLRRLGLFLLRAAAALAVFAIIAALSGFVVVQSGWFHEYVRRRIIAELERATGGRVEMGRFSFRGATLTATASPLVLHGTEPAGEPPLLEVASVSVGLRIISLAERKVDLALVRVDQPHLRIIVYPDGATNFPGGGRAAPGGWPQQLLNLAVQHYEVTGGEIEVEDRTAKGRPPEPARPFNLRGDGLGLNLTYDPGIPAYQAQFSSRGVRIVPPGAAPVELGFSSQLALEKSRLAISALRLSTRDSHADFSGNLQNPVRPHGTLKVTALVSLPEMARMFPLPIQPAGSANFAGTMEIDSARWEDLAVAGNVVARGLAYSSGRLHISGAQVRATLSADSGGVNATSVEADALGASFQGAAHLEAWRDLHVEGMVGNLAVAQAAAVLTPDRLPWDGVLSGNVVADATLGQDDAHASVNLAVSPAPEGAPLNGALNATYDQRQGSLILGDSVIATPQTRLQASGTLGGRMQVQLHSTNIGDVLAALPLLDESAAAHLPKDLRYGSLTVDGAVIGPMDRLRYRGLVNVTQGSVEGHSADALDAQVDLAQDQLSASRFTLSRGPTQIAGAVTLTAHQGGFTSANIEDAAADAQLTFRNANLAELVKEAGSSVAVKGDATGTVRLTGTLRNPQAAVTVAVSNPQGFGESLDRISATLRLTRSSLEVSNGVAEDGPARVSFAGSYRPLPGRGGTFADWNSGDLSIDAATRNLPTSRLEDFVRVFPGLEARITADVRAQGRITPSGFTLRSSAGTLGAQSVTLHGQAVGQGTLVAEMRGQQVFVSAQGVVDGSNVTGSGSWRLDGDQSGTATLQFSRMNLEQAHRLAMVFGAAPPGDEEPLPLEGFLGNGNATLDLALTHPRDFRASVTLARIQLNPRAGQVLGIGVKPQDLVLASDQPVVLDVDSKQVRIRPARLLGTDTNLQVNGTVPFADPAGASIGVKGGVNLGALQLISPSLLARGAATVEATIRGPLTDWSLNGRMDLKGASLYLKDVTTGLDNVNGGVLFNRTRATIDKLTAQLANGSVSLGGFVEFGTPLVYRLQAAAQQVRVRLPVALSSTVSANLALGGTSDASTLSGTLTLNRAAFNPSTDLNELFAALSQAVPEPSPSDYLRGMQFDVRVVSAPNFDLQTALTRDVQAEVSLRLRGTPLRPLLLGSVSVNSGEVQFFGNRYTIDRGEIRFTNPVKIDPLFDVVLETRISGVAVNIALSGPVDKLKTNYSSDPPLESSKIVALLAVGRDPTQYAGAASAQTTSDSTNFVGPGGGLLSQALAAQLSSKLQRFLGASRVKIDPTMTGVYNTPQARLTFEQQVSKDVTVTYITNLNYTQEQIVRLQWDLTPTWSAVAVRDANGLFGIDFQYRKSFK